MGVGDPGDEVLGGAKEFRALTGLGEKAILEPHSAVWANRLCVGSSTMAEALCMQYVWRRGTRLTSVCTAGTCVPVLCSSQTTQ